MACLFCKIAAKEIPAKVVLENEHVVAFHDLNPTAPTHVLVIPRAHIVSLGESSDDNTLALGEVLRGARLVAEKLDLKTGGFRVVLNSGEGAGQSVLHLHAHVIAGRPLSWPPG